MKTNTTIGIVALCTLCVAMTMSGCISPSESDEDVLFSIDLITKQHSGPGVMEVRLNEDSTATITTITGNSDTTEVGTWQFYRESADHRMYDILTDETELRVALQPDGHAIAYIYEDKFTRCGEPFYGIWEQPNEESTTDDESTDDGSTSIISGIIDSVTGDESIDMPVTMFVDIGPLYGDDDEDIIRITLSEDGTVESCGVDGYYTGEVPSRDCEPGTWEKHGSSGREYDVDTGVLEVIHVILLPDEEAEFEFSGITLKGTWVE